MRPRSWSTTQRLAFLCLVVCAVHVVRSLIIGYAGYSFLLWNLFLAWIPYWLGLAIDRLASRSEHGTGLLVLPTALWLLFFPNAPYIVTDLVHLRGSEPRYLILDAVVIASFAALGMALGLLSLRRVHAIVARRLGERLGWAFVGSVFVLTGAGVWMGRVLRWNSWDVVTHPMPLLRRTFGSLLKPWDHLPSVTFTLLFALGLFLLYERFVHSPRTQQRSGRRLRLFQL